MPTSPNPTSPDGSMVERVARAIADQVGDGFDSAHRDKPHWVESRGYAGARYRDINEPRQNDYLDAARAAIEAMREPTEAMVDAGDRTAEMLCYAENGCENCEPTASPGFQAAASIFTTMIDEALK